MDTNRLLQMKQSGEKIACLTAYDASFAQLFDKVGVDVILIGDSLGMVVQGHDTTLPVTITDICYHTKAVASKTKRVYLMSDMPYQSYNTPKQALENAKKLIDAGAQMVKIEGFNPEVVEILVSNHIAVCAHLGLQPQSISTMDGFKVQGKDTHQAAQIMNDALVLESHGVDAILLECIPAELAKRISSKLNIPTIGIGAGVHCDGQILVCYDALGITLGKPYKFVKNFLAAADSIEQATKNFIVEVKQSTFPDTTHSF